jgi:hypothetical protein
MNLIRGSTRTDMDYAGTQERSVPEVELPQPTLFEFSRRNGSVDWAIIRRFDIDGVVAENGTYALN